MTADSSSTSGATSEAYVDAAGLRVAAPLHALVTDTILADAGVDAAAFWQGLADAVVELGAQNRALLERRDELQSMIDAWLREDPARVADADAQEAFLRDICYLVAEPDDAPITPANVDPEIATVAGPQLVVPVDNARYALNAANARWGSLYDALYGTDVIDEAAGKTRSGAYNPVRGAEVVARAMAFLDDTFPLVDLSHGACAGYRINTNDGVNELLALDSDGAAHALVSPEQLRGFRGDVKSPEALLFVHHGLHVDVIIDHAHPVGAEHPAGVRDVVLESAVTTIQDCEDSVAAVDAEDKCRVYRNWHGLMNGTLEARFDKQGQELVRKLAPDREYTGTDGKRLTLPGRSLLLVRNVGLHMYTDAVLDPAGEPIPEGFLDAFVTAAAAKGNLEGRSSWQNSAGSIYIVKPKQHGPDEVAFTVALFGRVERTLGLDDRTLKLGIMDEERRTTLNLAACIAAASDRVIFINTGFLDRTGDEIHTLMEAGPFVPKAEIKSARWIAGYEDWNVDLGLLAGFNGRAQIGKGMWAMPDDMADMLEQKLVHPQAGASTAWVPSPTAATLHAMHYHRVSVADRQAELAAAGRRATLNDLLSPALLGDRELSADEIDAELRSNAQSILGYVVRWVGQGVGCSKVPDLHDVGLMEDRATLRISSQHVGNWLRHGLVTEDQVRQCFAEMAGVVDGQNAGDAKYAPMAADLGGNPAYSAALELVLLATEQPNGYTEFILNRWRQRAKRPQA